MTIVSLGVRPPRRSQKQCDALFRFSSISPCLRQPWKISSESIWTDVFLIVWAHWLRNNNFELKAAVRCIRSRLSGWFHTLRDTLEVKENVIGASQSNENKNNSKGSFQGQCLCYSGKPTDHILSSFPSKYRTFCPLKQGDWWPIIPTLVIWYESWYSQIKTESRQLNVIISFQIWCCGQQNSVSFSLHYSCS